jgi:hypothetical protein
MLTTSLLVIVKEISLPSLSIYLFLYFIVSFFVKTLNCLKKSRPSDRIISNIELPLSPVQ